MVTPFDDRGDLDEDAAVALMHHLIEHGSDGLVVCGTTGEAATMDDDEHLRVIELTAVRRPGFGPADRAPRLVQLGAFPRYPQCHTTWRPARLNWAGGCPDPESKPTTKHPNPRR
jgi:hypothetical protein